MGRAGRSGWRPDATDAAPISPQNRRITPLPTAPTTDEHLKSAQERPSLRDAAPPRPGTTRLDGAANGGAACENAAVTSSPDSPAPAQPEQAGDLDDAWLVVPLYNEAQVVREVIQNARRTFPHVVVVDDGSRDDSAARAEAAGAVVVRHPINLGQGAALQTGICYVLERTDARYLVTFDADGQHSVADAAVMVSVAREEGLAIVLGSRFLEGPSPVGRLKRLVLATAAAVASRTTGMRMTDAHNGLRMLRRDAAERLDLRQNRMAHASEIIRQLGATGLPWREFPVHIAYTEYSRAKGQSLLNSVNILVDLIFS